MGIGTKVVRVVEHALLFIFTRYSTNTNEEGAVHKQYSALMWSLVQDIGSICDQEVSVAYVASSYRCQFCTQ